MLQNLSHHVHQSDSPGKILQAAEPTVQEGEYSAGPSFQLPSDCIRDITTYKTHVQYV